MDDSSVIVPLSESVARLAIIRLYVIEKAHRFHQPDQSQGKQ
jgi:hypothetical protein